MNRVEQIFLRTASISASLLERIGIFSLWQKKHQDSVIILMYHGITATTNPLLHFDHKHVHKEKFEAQLRYLKKKYTVIGLEDFIAWKKGDKPLKNAALLTFDDGYKNCYSNLFPLLKKYNIPALIFLPTAFIGKNTVAWYDSVAWMFKNTKKETITYDKTTVPIRTDKQKIDALVAIKHLLHQQPQKRTLLMKQLTQQMPSKEKCADDDFCFLSWNECKEMQRHGIAFGSHSVTHPDMTAIPSAQLQKEFLQSKQTIETMLGTSCFTFAYPFGKNTVKTQEALHAAGYLFGFTTSYGKNATKTKNSALHRISINNLYDLPLFILTLFVNFPSFHHWVRKIYGTLKSTLS